MRHLSSTLLITLMFGAMLLFPRAVFNGASEGLLLWFQVVFPTLFPFMLITNLLMASGGISFIAGMFRRPFRQIFGVSGNGSFAVLAGFQNFIKISFHMRQEFCRTPKSPRGRKPKSLKALSVS